MSSSTTLRRNTIGFWSCLSVSVGCVVASSTLISLGQGMGLAGAGFVIAMAAAWLLQHFSAQSYSELACMMPHAGGVRTYTRVAFGALPAMVATIAGYVIPNFFAAPTELAIAGSVISEALAPWMPASAWGVLLLVALVGFNLVGVDLFGRSQVLFTAVMMIAFALLGVIGLANLGNPAPELPAAPFNPLGWGVLGLTALAIWLYIGIEFVTPMAEEAIRPEKNIPRAMTIGLLLILGVNLLYGFASIKYLDGAELAESQSPHVAVAAAILGPVGKVIMAVVSIFATASTISTVVGVVPRMLYGMAAAGELPRVFAWIHPRYRTPWVGILFMGTTILGFFVGGIANSPNLVQYILAACCSWLVCYIVAHLDVMVLRWRYPHVNRPYRAPWFPIPQVLGILGMGYALLNIFPDPVVKSHIFKLAGLLIAGAVVYSTIWLKFVRREPLFEAQPFDEASRVWVLPEDEAAVDLAVAGPLAQPAE